MLLSPLRNVVVVVLAASVCACGTGDMDGRPGRLAVLSAFPAELAPLLEQTTVDEAIMLGDRVLRTGMLRGVPVVLGLTGIGLMNAAATTRAVLEKYEVRGVVVSGVAGSPLRIGDVVVPAAWALMDGTTYTAYEDWLELIDEIAAPGNLSLEHCTSLPFAPSQEPVCLPHEPAVVVGGFGRSRDPFRNRPFPCLPNGDDVFGCDVASEAAPSKRRQERRVPRPLWLVDSGAATAIDMETAAVAREAAGCGIPFIAFRAVSDGAGDPLGLPGFPAQFFAYYRLAAGNAAAATVAFVERMAVPQ